MRVEQGCTVPGLLCPHLYRSECWIALIDLIRDHEVTAGDGEPGTLWGVKCVALSQLDQLVEADDSDDTGSTVKHKRDTCTQACDGLWLA